MKEEDIRYICKLLEDPTLTQTEEFKQWMQDKGHADLYWDTKAAVDNSFLENTDLPELSEEWIRFKASVETLHAIKTKTATRRSYRRGLFRWSVAAMFCLMLGSSLYFYFIHKNQPVILIQALSSPQNIIISSQDGDTVLLNRKDTVYAQVGSNKLPKPVYNTISTPRGKDIRITLSDGTEVVLNAESSLRYPVSFTGKERVVELKGEAYFNVAKDSEKPFVVETSTMQTKVLGTGFNVKAYPHTKPHVTLVEGSIAVRLNDSKQTILLNPGEDVSTTDDADALEIQTVDVRKYTSWTNGFFFFEEAPLEDIMRELGRWYNVNVEFSDPKTMNYHFNFWVDRNRNINETLKLLQQVNKVKISFKDNTITIS